MCFWSPLRPSPHALEARTMMTLRNLFHLWMDLYPRTLETPTLLPVCNNLFLPVPLCGLGSASVMDKGPTESDRVSRLPVFWLWSISSCGFCLLQIHRSRAPTAGKKAISCIRSRTKRSKRYMWPIRCFCSWWITWAWNCGKAGEQRLQALKRNN